jgi:hypothetical protein
MKQRLNNIRQSSLIDVYNPKTKRTLQMDKQAALIMEQRGLIKIVNKKEPEIIVYPPEFLKQGAKESKKNETEKTEKTEKIEDHESEVINKE